MKEGARTDFRAQTEDEGSIHAWKGVCSMNKIYKVVWNAARNSYMVGSEFIRGSHSAGSRRISGRKLKGLVAAALLAGAAGRRHPLARRPHASFGFFRMA